MKASMILRKAAERISEQTSYIEAEGCCWAILTVAVHARNILAKERARKYLKSLFENEESYWFGTPWLNFPARVNTEAQNHRIIALLLTADMAESVGD